MKNYKSSGVGYTETEVFSNTIGPDTLTTGIVGGAKKGPFDLTLITSVSQLHKTFGTGSIAVEAAEDVLVGSNKIYFQRVGHVEGETPSYKKGTAGTASTDSIIFTTKTYDSTLNGANIVVSTNKTKTIVSIKLVLDGETLEEVTGLSLVTTDSNYVITAYNSRSSYLIASVGTKAPVSGTYAGGTLTVRDGNDGISGLTASEIIGTGNTGLQIFKNPESLDISTLIAPGWSDATVIKALEDIAEYRGDICCIVDPPQGLTPNQMLDWANATGTYSTSEKLDSKYLVTYYPWVKRKTYDGKSEITVAPSGVMAGVWGTNDSSSKPWFAPAGFYRGVCTQATGLAYDTTKEERDSMYEETNIINPIVDFKTKGVCSMGNKTANRNLDESGYSYFSSINIRRMCNYIKKFVINISLTELFNPNDSYTWNSWKLKVDPKLREIKSGRGIEGYKIIMDETTVDDTAKENGEMPGVIMIKPVDCAEYISISFAVTKDGTSLVSEE